MFAKSANFQRLLSKQGTSKMAVSSGTILCASWQWKRDDGGFSPYSPEKSKEIEQARISGKATVSLPNYTVNIKGMLQQNKSSGHTRAVKRVELQLPNGQSTVAYWTWAESRNNFVPYDMLVSIVIEEYHLSGYSSVDLSTTSVRLPYTIDIAGMEQKRHAYNTVRKIRRCPLPTGTTLQSLLAIPLTGAHTPASYINSYQTAATAHPFNGSVAVSNISLSSSGPALSGGLLIPARPHPSLAPSYSPCPLTGVSAVTAYPTSYVNSTPALKSNSLAYTNPMPGLRSSSLGTTSMSTPLSACYSPPYTPAAMPSVTASPSSVPFSTTMNPSLPVVGMGSKVNSHSPSAVHRKYIPSDALQAKNAKVNSKSGGVSAASDLKNLKAVKSVKSAAKQTAKSSKGKGSKKNGGRSVAGKGKKEEVPGLDKRFSEYVRAVDWVKNDQDGPCPICMNNLTEEAGFDDDTQVTSSTIPRLDVCKLRSCRHMLHRPCLLMYIKSTGTQSGFQCPNCKKSYGVKTGDMPSGTMTVKTRSFQLSGHEGYNTIEIVYSFKAGVHNGRRYRANGFPRTCYLPDSPQGQKVLRLLRIAWDRKLTFTIGTSVTTGATDTVVWNEIHHKTETNNHSGHGYPDPNYLDNVLLELAAQGVEEVGREGVEECESEDEVFVISSDEDDP